MSLRATLTRSPRSAMPSRISSYCDTTARASSRRQDVLAEQRRVRVAGPCSLSRASTSAHVGEGLARDEALRAEAHAVPARHSVHRACCAPAARMRSPERPVDLLGDRLRCLPAGLTPGRPRAVRDERRADRSAASSERSGARTAPAIGTPRSAQHRLERRRHREPLERRRAAQPRRRLRRALAHGRDDQLGKRRGERRDRSDRTAGQPAIDQRLGPDEDVEPVDQVGLEALPGRLRDLQAGEVRDALAQPLDHRQRTG